MNKIKKLIIILILILILWSSSAFCTTYYTFQSGTDVKVQSSATCSGSGCWSDTGAIDPASDDLEAVLAAYGKTGNVIVIDGGTSSVTWTGTMLDGADGIDTQATNFILRGALATDPDGSNHCGRAILDGSSTNDYTLRVQHANVIISDIYLVGPPAQAAQRMGALVVDTTNDVVCEDFHILSSGEDGLVAINTNALFRRFTVKDIGAHGDTETYALEIVDGGNDNSPTFINGIIENGYWCQVGGGRNPVFANVDIIGMEKQGLLVNTGSANSRIDMYNCRIVGNGLVNGSTQSLQAASGKIYTYNCLIQKNPRDPQAVSWTTTADSGNLTGTPGFVNGRHPYLLWIGMDDAASINDFATLAYDSATLGGRTLEDRGWYGCFCVNTQGMSAENWTTANTLYQRGHLPIVHSRWHSNLADSGALRFNYGGGVACTIDVDITYATQSCTITIDSANDADDQSYSTGTNTVADVVTAMHGVKNLTVTSNSTSSYNDSLPIYCLADSGGAKDINGVNYDVDVDATNRRTEEITAAKSDIESYITGFTAEVFCYPYSGPGDEDDRDAVKNAGFIGAFSDSGEHTLESIDIYDIDSTCIETELDTSDCDINVRANLDGGRAQGWAGRIYDHDFAGSTSKANWLVVLDEIEKYQTYGQVYVMTADDIIDHIKGDQTGIITGTVATSDSETYVRDGTGASVAMTDQSDYHITLNGPYNSGLSTNAALVHLLDWGMASTEIVTDGECTTESFTNNTGDVEWAYNAVDDDYDAAAATASHLITQDISAGVSSGDVCRVIYEVTAYTAGTHKPYLCGTNGTANTGGIGRYIEIITSGATGNLQLSGNTASTLTATVDNFSVRQIADQAYDLDGNAMTQSDSVHGHMPVGPYLWVGHDQGIINPTMDMGM